MNKYFYSFEVKGERFTVKIPNKLIDQLGEQNLLQLLGTPIQCESFEFHQSQNN